MVFNSLVFVAFFIVVYGLYLVLPHRGQNRMLLVASYVFYGWWDWRFLGLIVLSTVVDFAASLAIDSAKTGRNQKRFLAVTVWTASSPLFALAAVPVHSPIRHLSSVV